MHYCNWNIADYMAHTGHLSEFEDLAYRRILDAYYLHESPPRGAIKTIARNIRMPEREAEVRSVIAQFFVRSPDGYRNKRADAEIARYRRKVEQASNAGRTSVERRLNGRSTSQRTDVQPTNPIPNPNPRNQEPTPEGGGVSLIGGGGGERGPEGADEQASLFAVLCSTSVRDKSKSRRVLLSRIAVSLEAQGMSAAQLRTLWNLARQESEKEPGGLLLHWIENGWREKLNGAKP